MARHLTGAKPLSKPMMDYCQLDSWEQISVNSIICIQENAFENVWKMAAILSLPQWVNSWVTPGINEQIDSADDMRATAVLTGGRFKNTYELLNLRALKISMLYKNHIFQCMDKIFCVEFQRVPLKFHTKYLTHILKDIDFVHRWKFKSLDLSAHKCFWNTHHPTLECSILKRMISFE